MIRFLLSLMMVLLVIGLNGCTDSDQYLFSPEETKNIEVQAFLTRSFEQESQRVKQDTIVPGDSIIFLTAVYPSKSIRLQRYYWNMDGKFFANEFSFKNTVNEPGIHKIEFILIDFFGDKVSDELTLYVGNPPVLSSENVFPMNNSQGINPTGLVNFSWAESQVDTLWQTTYRFTLLNVRDQELLVDTLLTTPHFTYYAGLKSQEKYNWNVSAVNELNMAAQEDIHATFYTKGYGSQGSVSGNVHFNLNTPTNVVDFTLLSKENTVVQTIKNYTLGQDGAFFLNALPEGDYSLTCSTDSFPDFKSWNAAVQIKADLVAEASFEFSDNILPRVSHQSGKDTLNPADTLKFIVTDGGGALSLSKMAVQLEETSISGLQYEKDTLIVPLSLEYSWTTKKLNISVQDDCGNRTLTYFYIRPTTTFNEVYGD